MLLWMLLTLMVAVAVSGLTFALVRGPGDERARETTASVLAAQLSEVDRQLGAGEISASDAGPLKNEIRRRILAEGREPEVIGNPLPNRAHLWLAAGIAGSIALGATGLYAMLGRPDLAAAPHVQTALAADTAASRERADVAAMVAKLEAKIRARPNDPEGWRLLGWSYLVTGRAANAAAAYAHAVSLAPRNADYRSSEGEALVRAAGGQVTPSALDAFRGALKLNPSDPRGKYYLALYKDQTGDHDGAMADWIALIRSAPPDAPWLPDLRRFVENVARERGLNIAARLPSPRDAKGGAR